MYHMVSVEERVRVPPTLTKMEVDEAIKEVLRAKHEGKMNTSAGFILKIVEAKPMGSGVVILGDPNIYYKTKYNMITFTAEANEVYTAVVKDIMEFGAFVIIGPFEALLHISQIARDRFIYDKKGKQLVSADGKKKIKEGDKLFVKVSTISMKEGSAEVKISVTMRGEGLGSALWMEKPKAAKPKKEKPAKGEKK